MKRGGRAFGRDFTQGSLLGNLMSLAWPMIVGSSVNMLGPTIDMIWVGRLGSSSIAGVGASGMVVMLLNSMVMGLYTGLRAMVARYIGAGESKMANHIAQQSIIITFSFSALMAAIGIWFAEPIMILMGMSPDVVAQGAPYLRINFIGTITTSFRNMTDSIMQASGDSVTPMWIALFFRVLHITLCPFLIFGWWLFPRMGVTGAATTAVISQAFGAALGVWFLTSGRTRIKLSLKVPRIDWAVIWRLVKISLPASFTGMERTLGQLILIWFMAPFGTLAIASHTLNQRVDFFLQMPAMGIGQSAGVLAGQNLGAGQPLRARKTGWLAAALLFGVMCILSIVVYFEAEHVVRIFNSEPGLVAIASQFLRIACVGYLIMAPMSVLQQCINTAGDTLIPMIVSLLNMYIIQVPLAYILPHYTALGVLGVRWAIVFGSASSAIIYITYFWMGRWQRRKV